MDVCGIASDNCSSPSTTSASGSTGKSSTANSIARRVHRPMSDASIASELTTPIPHNARAVNSSNAVSRCRLDNRFESSIRAEKRCVSRIAAAATTGPANGPRPTSSTPAIRTIRCRLNNRLRLRFAVAPTFPPPLFNACMPTDRLPKIVELGTPHLPPPYHLDTLQVR